MYVTFPRQIAFIDYDMIFISLLDVEIVDIGRRNFNFVSKSWVEFHVYINKTCPTFSFYLKNFPKLTNLTFTRPSSSTYDDNDDDNNVEEMKQLRKFQHIGAHINQSDVDDDKKVWR